MYATYALPEESDARPRMKTPPVPRTFFQATLPSDL